VKEDESLKQRLNEWIDGKNKCDRLCSDDLAMRVRKLRSVRTRRRRSIVASVVLLFTGIGVYFATFRTGAEPVPDSKKQLALNNGSLSSQAAESDLEVTLRLDELSMELEKSNAQIEVLLVGMRIQQAIAEAEILLRENERRMLREEQAAQWVAATFQEMAVLNNQ
jgi:hypothetical protein